MGYLKSNNCGERMDSLWWNYLQVDQGEEGMSCDSPSILKKTIHGMLPFFESHVPFHDSVYRSRGALHSGISLVPDLVWLNICSCLLGKTIMQLNGLKLRFLEFLASIAVANQCLVKLKSLLLIAIQTDWVPLCFIFFFYQDFQIIWYFAS